MSDSLFKLQGDFPKGSQLLIQLHQEEAIRQILIPGHRFEPFRPLSIYPGKLMLETENGMPFPSRQISIPLKNLYSFYTIIGIEKLEDYLCAEFKGNSTTLNNITTEVPEALVRIKAYDISELFPDKQMKAGDYLEATLLDEKTGRFSLKTVPTDDARFQRRESWFTGMDTAFAQACAELETPKSNRLLVETAYRYADHQLYTAPAASLSEYVNSGHYLSFHTLQWPSVLWLKHQAPSAPGLPKKLSKTKPGNPELGKLEKKLEKQRTKLDISLDPFEMMAVILDDLYHGLYEPGTHWDRTFGDSLELRASPYDLEQFRQTYFKIVEILTKSYDKSQDSFAEIRSACIQMQLDNYHWIQSLDKRNIPMEQLPYEAFQELVELLQPPTMVLYILHQLQNQPDSDLEELVEFQRLSKEVNDQLDMTYSLVIQQQEEIENQIIKKTSKKSKSGGKKPRPKDYILEITINGIEPSPRRVLRIPGECTLADLHDIIQFAFGWTDSHLHLFAIKGTNYTDTDAMEDTDMEDELDLSLDEFKLRAGSSFTYEYDFGDSWIHNIRVLSTEPADKDSDRIILLDGELNGPPEDCGGIWGYQQLVEALKTPKAKRSKEQTDLVEWSEGWKPTTYKPQKIQQYLDQL